jgi:hypothetical protein
VKKLATIGFIAVIAVIGVVVGLLPTVVDGRILAADLLPSLKRAYPRIESMECDREIRIGTEGATFTCTVTQADGTKFPLECSMDRTGSVAYRAAGALPARR